MLYSRAIARKLEVLHVIVRDGNSIVLQAKHSEY